mmetsp:Transcript_100691/g.260058  ORF Transcript_100691/g.260058 Transcript_100691/m.260058 type:complete len:338 (-) Transcript_100691:99-1112(-)
MSAEGDVGGRQRAEGEAAVQLSRRLRPRVRRHCALARAAGARQEGVRGGFRGRAGREPGGRGLFHGRPGAGERPKLRRWPGRCVRGGGRCAPEAQAGSRPQARTARRRHGAGRGRGQGGARPARRPHAARAAPRAGLRAARRRHLRGGDLCGRGAARDADRLARGLRARRAPRRAAAGRQPPHHGGPRGQRHPVRLGGRGPGPRRAGQRREVAGGRRLLAQSGVHATGTPQAPLRAGADHGRGRCPAARGKARLPVRGWRRPARRHPDVREAGLPEAGLASPAPVLGGAGERGIGLRTPQGTSGERRHNPDSQRPQDAGSRALRSASPPYMAPTLRS